MARYVLGDVHGNLKALKQVLEKSKFDYEKDFLIIIGDVVDGYNCSYEVVEELLKVKNYVFIIGNHDMWFMDHMASGWSERIWISQGGRNTKESYKSNGYYYNKFPDTHKEFFNSGVFYYEVDDMMFVHGGFDYPKHPRDCTSQLVTWDRELIERFKNGLKVKEYFKIFVGHTTTENEGADVVAYDGGEGYAELIQVDCGAGWKGRLCLYNIDTDDYFLSDYAHELNPEDKNE